MLAFVLGLVAVALVLQYLSLRRGFEGVSYSLAPVRETVEPDEPFELVTRLHNGTRRFLPYIGLRESVPAELELLTQGVETRQAAEGSRQMLSSTYLMPRQHLERRVSASLPRRGRYFFRGATLSLGDFLGLAEAAETFSRLSEIVVIPRPLPHPGTLETLGGFLGDLSVRRFILEDPVLTLGFREYTMREPLKRISWTQTARMGRIMVKNYDHTRELTVSVLLNVQLSGGDAELHPLIETCFSLARTVCETLEARGIQYDFITNASAAGALSLWRTVGEGLGGRHLATILEGLGRATYACTQPFAALLDGLIPRALPGRSYILITPQDAAAFAGQLRRLEHLCGGPVALISAREVMGWD